MAQPSDADEVKLLTSGVRVVESVNAFTWSWYQMPLEEVVNGTSVSYNAVIEVDAESINVIDEAWTKYDVLILNGTLPGNAQPPFDPGPIRIGDPACWIGYECEHAHVLQFQAKQRVTASFGFNYTAPGGFGPPLSHLIVGVRESENSQTAASFSIRVTRLPRVLLDGMVIDSAVSPCAGDDVDSCRQYFTVPVSGFDILRVQLERTGDNLTHVAPDGVTRVSNGGRGLVGHFFVGAPSTYAAPPPLGAAEHARLIDNVTHSVEAEYFCTLQPQAGAYTLSVVPGDMGGFGAELLTSAAELTLQAQTGTPGVARQGRGRFRLRIRHAAFQDGEIGGGGGSRPGCVNYGQTRNYSMTSSGMGDANLYAEVHGNVSSMRARCAGCDWVEATPPLTALAASPCTMRNSTTWELQLTLADPVTATLAGLAPTEFVLTTQLQNATLEPGDEVRPRALGGRGYLCCGAVQSYIIPGVPQTSSLQVELNVTMGHVRAAFMRHGGCADPAAHVSGALCTGNCEMAWFTVYDEFYGTMEFMQDAHLAIPFGPDPWQYNPLTTKRRAGDWYISVQALPGVAAEYRLGLTIREPPRPPDVYSCSRFNGFCPQAYYHHGLTTSADSPSSSGAAARGAAAAGLAMPLLCTFFAIVANLLGSRRAA